VTWILLAVGFAVVLAGALLFTNAVEWLGHRLELGQGAVGSVLAAVATALPESIIPIVALVGGREGSGDVAIGAIIGAPFMLATIAMALVAVSAFAFAGRREQGRKLVAHRPTLRRDLIVFVVLFSISLGLGLGAPRWLQYLVAAGLIVSYAGYVRATIRGGGERQDESSLSPLLMHTSRGDPPPTWLVVVQLLVALGAIVGGADLFVEELLAVADAIGVDALVLSLVLAPLATELPEKANSFFWIREGKDSLALGNITGAMVFQSAIPVSIGLVFTSWELSGLSILACALALAGALVAILALTARQGFDAVALTAWVALFTSFVAFVTLA